MSGGYPRMRFCEAPDVESATRLDLHNAGISFNGDIAVLADGLSFGVPSVASPAGARVQVLGDRAGMRLPVQIGGTKPAATRALNLLMRELLRRENWLEIHVAAEVEPRWLRTLSTVPEPVSMDRVYDSPTRRDHWVASVPLVADPLAVGPESVLGSWTVTNNPASGDQPMVVELPAVEGEAPAPLLVKVVKAATGGMLGPALGCSRVPPVVTAAPGSWGSAVGSAVTDTGMIGGDYRQTTGTLDDWTAVGTWTPDAGDLPGGDHTRWAPLLRVDGSTDAGAFRLRWRIQASGISSVVYSQPATVDVSTQSRWVRTGEVPCPMLDMTGLGVTADTTLTLEVQRLTTGGELRFDEPLMLVPAAPDSDLLLVSPDDITTAVTVLVDADQRRVAMASGTSPTRRPGVAGGWPHAVPGESNYLLVMQSLDPTHGTGVADSASSTTEVTVTYRPCYVWGV